MQLLTVEAAGRESANDLCGALSSFQASLVETADGRYQVAVQLGSTGRDLVAVLNAIDGYVRRRWPSPARVELDGRKYMLHAD